MTYKNRIVQILAEIRARLTRGQQWFYEIRNAFLIAAGLKVIFPAITWMQTFWAIIGILIAFIIVGHIDLRYIQLQQAEQILQTSKYNPHLNQLNTLLKKRKI